MNYVNIRGLRVHLDGVTFAQAAAEIRRMVDYYESLAPYKSGCIARPGATGVVLVPCKIEVDKSILFQLLPYGYDYMSGARTR